LLGLIATSSISNAGTTLTFSPLSLAIPALKGLSEGVKHIGADKGYEVIVVDPNFDAPTQAEQLNQLITTGKTQAAWGGMIGSSLGDCVTEKLGGKAKVIFIQGTEGIVGKESIDAEMLKGLTAKAAGAEIVATIVVKDRVEAQTKIGQVLQAHPDANALMTPNDEGGLGALGAYDAAGKTLTCLVDGGGNDEVLKAVDDGKMYASAALNFKGDVMQTFDAIADMLKDPKAQGKQLTVPLDLHKKP
jgi:ABC-type sugar transport system substrate-binding protein